MLQPHLSYQQWYWLLRCPLYWTVGYIFYHCMREITLSKVTIVRPIGPVLKMVIVQGMHTKYTWYLHTDLRHTREWGLGSYTLLTHWDLITIYIIKWIIGSSWWIPGMFGVTHYLNQPRLIWIIGKISKTYRSIRRIHRKVPSPKPRSDWNSTQCVNTLRPRQNGRHHTHDTGTVRCTSLNDFWI